MLMYNLIISLTLLLPVTESFIHTDPIGIIPMNSSEQCERVRIIFDKKLNEYFKMFYRDSIGKDLTKVMVNFNCLESK